MKTLDKKEEPLISYVGKAQTLEGVFKKIKERGMSIIFSEVSEVFEVIEPRKDFAIISEDYMPEGMHPYGSRVCYYPIIGK